MKDVDDMSLANSVDPNTDKPEENKMEEAVIKAQAQRIADLEKEIVRLKSEMPETALASYGKQLENECLRLHQVCKQVLNEKQTIEEECNILRQEKDEMERQYQMVINSKSWKMTQGLRDVVWTVKGRKEVVS